MKRTTNARIAGAAFLLYIAAAFPASMIGQRMLAGATTHDKLATLHQHVGAAHLTIVLGFISGLCAFALAISLNALTRDEDADIARFGLLCRFGEGLLAAPFITLALIWLAGRGADPAQMNEAIAALLIRMRPWQVVYAAYIFALGSTAFCFLLLRGRLVPTWLGWLGFLGSLLLVPTLPLVMLGRLGSPYADLIWAPIAVFEIVVAVWFLATGGVRKRR
jgi:hypothetical protein